MKNAETVYRLIPCPSFDVEGTESWLSDMAEQGLILTKDGLFMGFATFEKGRPQKIRYRLEAAPNGTSMWGPNEGEPDEEFLELSKKYGWEYIAKRGDFHIYRSFSNEARELNTDPQVQAISLSKIKSRLKSNMFYFAFWILIWPLLQIKGALISILLPLGFWRGISFLGLMLWNVIDPAVEFFRINALRKSLLADGYINHKKNWKKSRHIYLLTHYGKVFFTVLWIVLFLFWYQADTLGEHEIPISDFEGEAPFATIADIYPGGRYQNMDMGHSNTYRTYGDFFAPVNYSWAEIGNITLPTGEYFSCILRIEYHELAFEWAAKAVAQDYYRKDTFLNKDVNPVNISDPETDYFKAYTEHGMTFFVIRQGKKVLSVLYMPMTHDIAPSLSELADLFAGSIA